MTIENLKTEPTRVPELVLVEALLYIPLMTTNVLATLLICYKAWYYEQNPSVTAEELIAV